MQRTLRWIAAAELAAMLGLILSYIWGWRHAFPGAFVLVTLGYFGIGILGHRWRGETLQHIGLRFDNWKPAVRNAAIVAAVAVSVALTVGTVLNSWHFPSWLGLAGTLPLTILWGTAQQYGLLCVIYRRFMEVFGSGTLASSAAALFFAIFHLPNSFLMAVTFVAGAGACVLYRRHPNVFAIGVAHALISFSLYYSLPFSVTAGLHVGPGYFTYMQLHP